MKVIKSINNNIAQCLDSKGREVVVFGKGIGFFRPDEDIPLSRINRTFYNIKDTDYGVLRTIPTVIINTAIYIVDMVSDELNVNYPSSKAISVADHLQFAIVRKNQNIYLEQPLLMDLRILYPREMELAERSLKVIEKMTGEKLPMMEAGNLVMHFIADRIESEKKEIYDTVKLTEECTAIIEKHFNVAIDRESFNYSRFISHLDYLVRRLSENKQIESTNEDIFQQLKQTYPDSYQCALKVSDYLSEKLKKKIYDEEVLYLVIHVNRLISRI